jgi:hypothetical protein
MPSESVQLRAQANRLGIEGYKTLSIAELRDAIQRAQTGGSTGRKRKSAAASADGQGSKRKSAAAVRTARKRKPASTRKSAPAVQSRKRGEAKRPTTARQTRKPASQTRTQTQTQTRRGRAPKPVLQPKGSANVRGNRRHVIQVDSIDFTLEWGGAKTGNRALIFAALKKFKGNRNKAFDSLKSQARAMYGRRRTKADAERLLRWHLSRVLLDYATATGQHKQSTLKGDYSGNRRGGRNGAPASKPAGGRRKASQTRGTRKSTRKPAGRQAASGGRRAASTRRATPKPSANTRRGSGRASSRRRPVRR